MKQRTLRLLTVFSIVALLISATVWTMGSNVSAEFGGVTDGPVVDSQPAYSHRLIVELERAPLAEVYQSLPGARSADGRMNPRAGAAAAYIAEIQAEQAAFMVQLQQAMPQARVSTYINEFGMEVEQAHQMLINAVVVDAGRDLDVEASIRQIQRMDGVRSVYRDYAVYPQMYESLGLINAPAAWNMLGGDSEAGKGIIVASVDGGLHKDAAMFSGEGWSYPAGWPDGGKGMTANNNGKIIASRAYFRTWDPPAPGDENPWPGVAGTSHGTHTGATAAGNIVTDVDYAGVTIEQLSGVAPAAWLMSYRTFYASVNGIASMYNAEAIAALEDAMNDGAHVVNNSWGGGPGGIGGDADPIDRVLINLTRAGVIVVMSNGNSGPNPGTNDHPSSEYINVAASQSGGTFASGRMNVIAPEPVTNTALLTISFATAGFGAPVPIGDVFTYTMRSALAVDSGNVTGCSAFPANSFDGTAALISRGGCEFGVKVLNAENAGAEFVVIYDDRVGPLINMGAGAVGNQVTIPSVFVGQTSGTAMANWHAEHGDAAVMEFNTVAFQVGNQPDVIANFSSRGPSTRNTMKPDIAAPGVNIMAQGYGVGVTGEARHLGFGQVSGTSMAAPHVAGAAALLKQRYPSWGPAEIKSALMSTSKFMEIYNANGSPAQPIDMGAGRLDVAAAMTPGVILNPPAADFGAVISSTGAVYTMSVEVRNIYTAAETYELSTLFTGNGFSVTDTTDLAGVSVSPTELTLDPGETATVVVSFDPAQGMGYDINQGYLIMSGTVHHAHMPFFARVMRDAGLGTVLLVDVDFSGLIAGFPDVSPYYRTTLENLGVDYVYWNTAATCCGRSTLAPFPTLAAFDHIIIFTGQNFYPDGSFTVPTPLTAYDMTLLNSYMQNGGKVMVMGQDATSVLNESFFHIMLGAYQLQDSVTGNALPSLPVVTHAGAPPAMAGAFLDLTGVNRAVGTATPVITPTSVISTASSSFTFNNFTSRLGYNIQLAVSGTLSITNFHIHSGTVGVDGPVLIDTIWPYTETVVVTNTFSIAGSVELTPEQEAQRRAGGLYMNFHSVANPMSELRFQIPSTAVRGDGTGDQLYIDELEPVGSNRIPLLTYPGPFNTAQGLVAMSRRVQPTLEEPLINDLGRSIFTSFGLEGVNNVQGVTTREQLMGKFISMINDEPTVTISHTQEVTTSSISIFTANFASNISDSNLYAHRWDFGDGSGFTGFFGTATPVQHRYAECGDYTVRVEAVSTYGNHTIGTRDVTITACPPEPTFTYEIMLPAIMNGGMNDE